jgi:hypothetical protein
MRGLAGSAAMIVLAAAAVMAHGCALVAGIDPPDVSSAKKHCINGKVDADETDIDCGGKDCLACGGDACTSDDQCQTGACVSEKCKLASCTDGIFDGYESALDCGDPSVVGCPLCAMGQNCWNGCNCQSGFCDPDTHTCGDGTANCNTCTDGVRDHNETGIDCGGEPSTCPRRCGAGQRCSVDTDCDATAGLHCDTTSHLCSQ